MRNFYALCLSSCLLEATACSDKDKPEVIICPVEPFCMESIDYHIDPYPAPKGLAVETPHLITSQKQLDEYFPGQKLKPVDFKKYSLLFMHGNTNCGRMYVGSEVWNNGGALTLKARVYSNAATVIDNWNTAQLVELSPADIKDIKAEVVYPSFEGAVWLEPESVEIPAENNPAGLKDEKAVVIYSPGQLEFLFGYSPQGIDFSSEGLIFIKGTAPNGIEEIEISLARLDKEIYYGSVRLTLNDTAQVTPWNVAVRVPGLDWTAVADISVTYGWK